MRGNTTFFSWRKIEVLHIGSPCGGFKSSWDFFLFVSTSSLRKSWHVCTTYIKIIITWINLMRNIRFINTNRIFKSEGTRSFYSSNKINLAYRKKVGNVYISFLKLVSSLSFQICLVVSTYKRKRTLTRIPIVVLHNINQEGGELCLHRNFKF